HTREVKCITSACLIRRCTIQRANLEMYKLCQQVRAIDGVLRWIKTDYIAWWLPNKEKTIDLTALKWEGTDVQMFKEEPLAHM
ncbi:hypothetical protein INO08_16215, partial [Staphylococcus aureus]|nr:hypothetical protein [Staphylococcus aureus]